METSCVRAFAPLASLALAPYDDGIVLVVTTDPEEKVADKNARTWGWHDASQIGAAAFI